MNSRYFLDQRIGDLEDRIAAFAAFSGSNAPAAQEFVVSTSELMRQAYHASCMRIARQGIEAICEELGIPETPQSWRIA